MRLGQLARKLEVKVNDIVNFLNDEHHIIIEPDLNTKIEGEALGFVFDHYKQEEIDVVAEPNNEEIVAQVEEEIVTDEKKDVIESVEENNTELINENSTTETENKNIDDVEEKLVVEDENGEVIELNVVDGVIKAPKKELSGPKVVGKIELSTPKKSVQHIKTEGNETINITDEIAEKRKAVAQLKREKYLKRKEERKNRQNKKKNRNKRRVLTELELKEKQAELLVKKRLEQAKVDKNKRKKHYEQIAQSKKKTNSKKTKKRKKIDESVVKTVKQFDKEPTTTLGKIWKWFNT